MKWIFIAALLAAGLMTACRPTPPQDHDADHAHDEYGNHISVDDVPLEPEAFTVYSGKTELLIEFKPLIKGMESRFAPHLTALGENFTALGDGSVTLSIVRLGAVVQSVTAEKPEVPGIFRLRLTPDQAGDVDLIFHIRTPAYTDTLAIHHVRIFEDEPAALAAYATPRAVDASSEDLTFLKEQAWKIEFANAPARIVPFADVIRTSGQIEAAPGDITLLAAQISGVLSHLRMDLVPGVSVRAHKPLFSIRPTDVMESNLDAAIRQAEQEVETARKQFERAEELAADKIVSEKAMLEIRQRLDVATTRLADLRVSRNFRQRQQHISSPIDGFVLHIHAANGQFVEAGEPIATVAANKRMLVRADISQRYFHLLGRIRSANIAGPDGRVYDTEELRGKVTSYGRMTQDGSPFVPFYFEIDRADGLIPGAAVQLYLLSDAQPALVIPSTAVLEAQGNYYVYVQTAGETFQKRDIRIGSTDGRQTEVLSGLSAGERVVTKGAYQIKLATAAGVIPAHGHEH